MTEPQTNNNISVDGASVARGVLWGFFVGALVTLFTAPKSRKPEADIPQQTNHITQAADRLRERVENVRPKDPIEESLAAGKAAARRRREELGLDDER